MENNDDLNALTGAAASADAVAAETVAPAAPAPDAAPGGPQISPDLIQAAMPEAVVIADAAAGFVKTKWGVELSSQTKEMGAQKLAPLLVKYDLDSPFLRKWRLEIDALIFVGATGYGIWKARKEAAVVVPDAGK